MILLRPNATAVIMWFVSFLLIQAQEEEEEDPKTQIALGHRIVVAGAMIAAGVIAMLFVTSVIRKRNYSNQEHLEDIMMDTHDNTDGVYTV